MPATPKPRRRPDDLREACVAEARKIIERKGIDALSMRDVARRIGVSHQAPYKHFESRDHIIAEIVARTYTAFAAHLEARPAIEDPLANLRALGETYLAYAASHPLEYQLMFETPLPEPKAHPAMLKQARHSFDILLHALGMVMPHKSKAEREFDALFIWSSLHGLASMARSDAVETLDLSAARRRKLSAEVLDRIEAALFR